MSEQENQDQVNNDEINSENSDENNSSENSDELPTYEDYLRLKERTEKAEKKLVELKKLAKVKKSESEQSGNVDIDTLVEKKLAEREFYLSNPDAKSYKDKITGFTSKGLSLDDAYLLASKSDREIDENRAVYGESQVGGKSQGADTISLLNVSQFDKLTPAQQGEYISKTSSKYGEVRFK